jgi:hypothetical protein
LFFLGPAVTIFTVMAIDEVGRGHLANLNVFDGQNIPQQVAVWTLYMCLLDFFLLLVSSCAALDWILVGPT